VEVNGGFSLRRTLTFERAGSYLFCAWLREDSGDVGGTPAPFTLLVRAPRPPCRVPRVIGLPFSTARTRIRRANCLVGRVRRARSRNNAGRVIRQSLRPGLRRPPGTRIDLVVGRRR
jgi:hypothetical protein